MEDHPYIHWQENLSELFSPVEEELFQASAIYVLTDENISSIWLQTLLEHCEILAHANIIELPAGEDSKEWEILSHVFGQLMEDRADKKIWIINVGGGTITDVGGMIASLYKRGVSFIHVPTTLMGMVDASIGGKNGINFQGNKNMLGTFQEPDALLIYPGFLDTLPEAEILSGLAEMLKHALIADPALWEALTDLEEIDANHLKPFIKQNIRIKNNIVFEDPFEENIRKKLNYGHTVGHAWESWSLENHLSFSHGYCVAQGMKWANYHSYKGDILDHESYVEINDFLEELFPIKSKPKSEDLLKFLVQDKKNKSENLQLTLLQNIGEAMINQPMSLDQWTVSFQAWLTALK